MAAFPTPERLASFSTRRPRTVVGTWATVVVAAIVIASTLGLNITSSWPHLYEEIEGQKALDIIDTHVRPGTPESELVVIQSRDHTVDDPQFEQFATDAVERLRALSGDVSQVVNYYEIGEPSLVSPDRTTLIVPVTLTGERDEAEKHARSVVRLVEELGEESGFAIATGGDGSLNLTYTETSESDLQVAEIIGLPVALIVLVVVFGALVAAGLPIGLGVVAIIAAIGATALLSHAWQMSIFVVNVITMIGLAVGIDYSLLIVQRFREERRRGFDRDAAIVRAGGTASRAVVFSGLTVIVALSGLLFVPDQIFRSVATGSIIVTIMAIAAALTLLPAALHLLGDRVDRLAVRKTSDVPAGDRTEGGFWNVVTGFVMNHAVLSLVVAGGLMVAAGLMYFRIETGSAGISALPSGSEPYEAFSILDREFSGGLIAPTEIVVAGDVNAPAVQDGIARMQELLAADGAFGPSTVEIAPDGTAALISAPVAGDPGGPEAVETLRRVRETYGPQAFAGTGAEVLVGGSTALSEDYAGLVAKYTPWVFGFVLGLSFVVLLVVFRSIVVPLKAIVMNLLSVGAAYGLMVLVFQDGIGHQLFRFHQVERIESWVPLFMFAILFGLSMDYHVFLLTRIRERFDHTRNNAESVAFGVRSTAGLITGAALIMVAVFGGFAAGEMVPMEQMGFGLSVAILLDATIVRVVLVPAAMELLGDRNWYLPSWLEWLPRVDVEGRAVAAPSAHDPAPGRSRLQPEGVPGQ